MIDITILFYGVLFGIAILLNDDICRVIYNNIIKE
jgi:hypothetical protein